MRVLLIGATGTIGATIEMAMKARGHTVLPASRSGDNQVDLGDPGSIKALFARVGEVDAIVSAAGAAPFGTLDQIDDDGWTLGLTNKLLGQINLVRFGRSILRPSGSITLTSGILADHPNPGSTVLSATNAGLHGFVGSAALQMTEGRRVNAVSPPLVRETAIKLGWGNGGMPAAQVAEMYVTAVEGSDNGHVFRA
jgi:NAD(P)-dependent dehydrogenase (short-subunit alcohol dehydrogenase family)